MAMIDGKIIVSIFHHYIDVCTCALPGTTNLCASMRHQGKTAQCAKFAGVVTI